jgi:glycosyltransferase involved in cell wall biosynthesis
VPVPKISVVIPVYNGETYIRSALESVLDQTYSDFEVIVVDDGSTDRSREVIAGLKRAVAYIYQENSGVAVARNHGFLHSRGQFIAFLDQDDRWYTNKLESQVAVLDQHPGIGITYSDVDMIDETGRVTDVQSLRNQASVSFLRRFPEFPHPHPFPSTVLMRREIFAGAGMFDPIFKRNCHEDTELWFRIAKRNLGKFHFYPASLVQRRQHSLQGGSEWQSREDNWIVCLTKLTTLYGSDAKQLRTLKHMLSRSYRQRGERLIKNGDWQKGRMYLEQSIKYDRWNWKNLLGYARALVG